MNMKESCSAIEPVRDLRGIITVFNTPFDESGDIDEESLKRNVEYAVESGVVGILFPAMASEVYRLSVRERLEASRIIMDTLNGRAAFIGGCASYERAERLEMARLMLQMGCEGILVNIPYENECSYLGEVEDIAALDPGFLMIQDWDFRGYGIPVPLIKRLFESIEVFKCLKIEVVPAGKKYSEVIAATAGRLHISGGWAVMQMIEALDRGVHAFMPTGMHRIYTRIFDLYSSGDREGAKELFYRVLPVLAFSNQHLDISIHFFKRLLHRQGIYSTAIVREPLLPFDGVHEKIAIELMEYAVKLEAAIIQKH